MVGLDGVEDVLFFLKLPAELHAQVDMGALVLVVQGLADVVEQSRPLGGVDVQSQLRGHEARDVADLDGVLEDVLPVAGAVMEAAQRAARPGARRENLENYIKRLEKLEEITGTHPGVEKSYAIQAGREVRVMVRPEQVSEDQMVILARDLAKKIENELEYPGQIKVHVIRETKVVEYAK